MGKADLHVHTTFSKDGTTTVRGALKRAAEVGLNVIAITDHDEMRGSLTACELAPQYGIEAIPAVEISAREGHILALFVEEPIPAGRTLLETLLRIGDQGGIAIAPHPVNPLPKSLPMDALVGAVAHNAAKYVLRGIEVYNMGYQIFNHLAQKISPWLPLAKTAGSDSHVYWTVGIGQTGFAGYKAADLRRALETMSTIPIPAPTKFTLTPILGWMGHVILRRFGYVAQNFSPDSPIVIRRNTLDRPTVPLGKRRRP
jgi:hypothetical protein